MMRRLRWLTLLPALLIPGLAGAETFWVTSTADSGPGSFREAIAASNTTAGVQTVAFAAPGAVMITTMDIIATAPVIVDGRGGTLAANSTPIFALTLDPGSDGSVVRNLAFGPVGNHCLQVHSTGNHIQGCQFGILWDGSYEFCMTGVYLNGDENLVGGSGPGDRNVFDAPGNNIEINANRNVVQGNYLGTTRDGLGSGVGCLVDIHLTDAANGNLIGGDANAGEGNVLASAANYGVQFGFGFGNTVCGNVIGLNAALTAPLACAIGVLINGTGNLVGGPNGGGHQYGNVIAGNTNDGVRVNMGSNSVLGNYIGVDPAGTLWAQRYGVRVINAGVETLIIGDPDPALRNVIAGSTAAILMGPASRSVITGNYLGVSPDGAQVLAAGGKGVWLSGSSACRIGGSGAGEGNWICGDGPAGIDLTNNAVGNTIVGNIIGVKPNGVAAESSFNTNVAISGGSTGNWVGLDTPALGNLIRGGRVGIAADGPAAVSNAFFSNTVCGFSESGILLSNGANAGAYLPLVDAAQYGLIRGNAVPGIRVQVFRAEPRPAQSGGSLAYVGAATTGGNYQWSLAATPGPGGDWYTALGTDEFNNTSIFAINSFMPAAPPTATITPTATPSPVLTATLTATFSPTPLPTATATPRNPLAETDLTGKLFLAYPNPARNQVTFILHTQRTADLQVVLYNLAGERIAELQARLGAGAGQVAVWDCSGAAPGIYLAHLVLDGKTLGTQKVAVGR